MSDANATEACASTIAKVVSVQGIVELQRSESPTWEPATLDMLLCAGDSLRARTHSRAAIRLSNDTLMRLDQRTTITIPKTEDNKTTSFIDLLKGAIHIITRTPQPFKVRTPFLNAGVEGTEFFVGVQAVYTQVVIYEGRVSASNEQGSLMLTDHEAAIAYLNQVPTKQLIIKPLDAVQWALYYPAIIGYHRTQNHAGFDNQLHEAEHLLSVGQVEEAKVIIESILSKDSDNSNAVALQSIIAVAQNDKEKALELAIQSITLDELSVPARLALSYAQQATFDINAALASIKQAVTLDPQNALIWARLTELQMSVGELEQARESAQEAVNLNPTIAKTQTVLGFAYLLQINTADAKSIFHEAILLDQADPMPRLGLGLALIREGQFEAGRVELEIAASLDPGNSLIRSYLGKAYFEENRYPLASTQFGLAKMLDSLDPTPWLYDAIQKQTQNQPIEALHDIQKSIKLNNNRAAYRSRLLLDQDEAARSTSLARIFDNLGFERRAIVETAKSLSIDPTNHSAHRFLSDAYIKMPLHTSARASELLQAQLLQPININPVQPPLAIEDFNILTETGVATTGFNEFTPLMERNKSQFIASGIVGSNGTIGDEIVFSKLHDKTSVSLGQYHFQSDGFKRNNSQKHSIVNAFIQHAVTPKLNIQAEFRALQSENENLLLDFGRENVFAQGRPKFIQDSLRVGLRYALSSNQNIIFTGKYLNNNGRTTINEIFSSEESIIDKSFKNTGFDLEAQHLFRRNHLNTVIGGGIYYFDTRGSTNFTTTRVPGIHDFPIVVDVNSLSPLNPAEQERIYFYSQINRLRNINLTLGLGYVNFQDAFAQERNDTINPKIGAQWEIYDNLRLRAAWFETTKPFVLAQQTIEPTQVAGFNQFFDDVDNTIARRIGIGLDYHLTHSLYTGIEVSERTLHVPITLISNTPQFLFQKQNERLYRGYLYLTPHPYWAAKSEFLIEKFTRNADDSLILVDNPVSIHNVNLPVSLEFFHPSGLFSGITGTYVKQDLLRLTDIGKENERDPHVSFSGIDDFFILDSVAGYRLTNRRGILSLEARNLLDEHFFYRNFNLQPIDVNNLNFSPTRTYIPARTFFLRLTLNF